MAVTGAEGAYVVDVPDIAVPFHSLASFLDTCELPVELRDGSPLPASTPTQCRVLSFVGLVGAGKTTLINKLFGKNFPTDTVQGTNSLSGHWAEAKRMLALDSPGFERTVPERADAAGASSQGTVLDAQATESLLLAVMTRLAHFVIVVVNDMSRREQELIARFRNECAAAKHDEELIVVHNLYTVEDVETAQVVFGQLVGEVFEGQASPLAELVFSSGSGARAGGVQHIVICKEGSAAGQRFNENNREYLLSCLQHRNPHGSAVTLTHKLAEELARALPALVARSPPSSAPLGVDYVAEPSPHLKLDPECLGLRRGQPVSLLEVPAVLRSTTFAPTYRVYDVEDQDPPCRVIEVECAGLEDRDIVVDAKRDGIWVALEKRKRFEEGDARIVSPSVQSHGKWTKDFKFDSASGGFEDADSYTYESGMLRIELRRRPNRRRLAVSRSGRAQ